MYVCLSVFCSFYVCVRMCACVRVCAWMLGMCLCLCVGRATGLLLYGTEEGGLGLLSLSEEGSEHLWYRPGDPELLGGGLNTRGT